MPCAVGAAAAAAAASRSWSASVETAPVGIPGPGRNVRQFPDLWLRRSKATVSRCGVLRSLGSSHWYSSAPAPSIVTRSRPAVLRVPSTSRRRRRRSHAERARRALPRRPVLRDPPTASAGHQPSSISSSGLPAAPSCVCRRGPKQPRTPGGRRSVFGEYLPVSVRASTAWASKPYSRRRRHAWTITSSARFGRLERYQARLGSLRRRGSTSRRSSRLA